MLAIVAWVPILGDVQANPGWTPVASMPRASLQAAFGYDGLLHVMGFQTQLYSPANDTWWMGGNTTCTGDRYAVIADVAYLFASGSAACSVNLTTGVASDIIDPPTSRNGYAVATAGGLVYVLGGWTDGDSTGTASVDVYNPANNTWWVGTPMLTDRKVHEAVGLGGYIYAIGGFVGWGFGTATASVERFDPATNRWTNVSPMLEARTAFGVAAHNGTIVVAGSGSVAVSHTEVYIPTRNEWLPGPPVPVTNYFDNQVASLGGFVYTLGGRTAPGALYNLAFRWEGRDLEPPSVSVREPAQGAIVASDVVRVNGTATDDTRVESVSVRVNGAAWRVAVGRESWWLDAALDPGVNLVEVQAQDVWGNLGAITQRQVRRDVGGPTLVISGPQPNETVTTSKILVFGSAADDVGVDRVELRVNAAAWHAATGTTEWTSEETLGAGWNTIAVRAVDLVGWASPTQVVFVQYLAPAPAEFSVSVDSTSVAGTTGDVVQIGVQVGSSTGWNTPVKVGVTGLPAGATYTFRDAWVLPPGSTALKISLSPSTRAGTFPLSVYGASAGRNETANVTLVVTAVAVGPTPGSGPNLISYILPALILGALAAVGVVLLMRRASRRNRRI